MQKSKQSEYDVSEGWWRQQHTVILVSADSQEQFPSLGLYRRDAGSVEGIPEAPGISLPLPPENTASRG